MCTATSANSSGDHSTPLTTALILSDTESGSDRPRRRSTAEPRSSPLAVTRCPCGGPPVIARAARGEAAHPSIRPPRDSEVILELLTAAGRARPRHSGASDGVDAPSAAVGADVLARWCEQAELTPTPSTFGTLLRPRRPYSRSSTYSREYARACDAFEKSLHTSTNSPTDPAQRKRAAAISRTGATAITDVGSFRDRRT